MILKMIFYSILRHSVLRFKKRYRSDNNEGSRFMDSLEMSEFITSRNTGLLLDGVDKRLSEKESFQNVCLVARVGAGKTTKYIIPNVLDKAGRDVSLVVHDPKGEVYDHTAGYMRQNGFEIVRYNPQDISQTCLFNPLIEAKTEIELEQVAETIIWSGNPGEKDAFWNSGAIRILNVLLKCLSFGDPACFNLPNLYYLLQNFGAMGEGLDDWISRNCWDPRRPNDPYVLNEWRGALTGNQEAIQSFVGICLTSLRAMSNKDMQCFFSKSDYKLSDFRKKKTIIYFITPPEHQQYYSFVTSLFFRSVFNECMRGKHLSGTSLPVYILYDEFGNSFVNDFVSVASTIRGYGVSLSIILQSISQLSMRYGRTTAESIQGAFNTNMCLSSSDPVTAEYFARMAGRERYYLPRDTSLLDTRVDYSERDLIGADMVRQIGDDEALVISRNKNPVKFEVRPYFKNRRFNKAASFPKPPFASSAKDFDIKIVNL